MKFSIEKTLILESINTVSKAISGSNALAILGNILIKARDGQLFFTATDLDLTIKHKVYTEVEKEGEITIPAKLLQSYIGLCEEGKLKFTLNQDTVTVKSNSGTTKIKGIPSDDYPQTTSTEENSRIKINSKKLKRALQETVFSTSISNSRIILTGVLFKITGKELELMSTDSYRFSTKKIQVSESTGDLEKIIPSKTINELIRILGDFENSNVNEEEVEILISNNQVTFKMGEIEVFSKIIEGQFPNCAMLIPASHQTKCVVSKSDLSKVVKRINIFAKENNNNIKLTFNPTDQKLEIKTVDTQIGADEAEIETAVEGDEITISLNSIYLLEIINVIKSSEIVIELNGQFSPVLFKDTEDKDFIHIIMPLRIT